MSEVDPREALRASIRNLRRRLGLSQRALAALVGVPQSTIYRWEAGHASPNGGHLAKLHQVARDHGVDSELLPGAGPAPSPDEDSGDRLTRAALRLMREQLRFCAALEEARGEGVGREAWDVLGETVRRHRSRLAGFLREEAGRQDAANLNLWRALSLMKVFSWRGASADGPRRIEYVSAGQLAPRPRGYVGP